MCSKPPEMVGSVGMNVMEKKFDKIHTESKVAARYLNKLAFLAPNQDLGIELCRQIFEKNPTTTNSPESNLCHDGFHSIFKILKKNLALKTMAFHTDPKTMEFHACRLRIYDTNFVHFLLTNMKRDGGGGGGGQSYFENLIELAETLKIIIFDHGEQPSNNNILEFDLILHVESVQNFLKDGVSSFDLFKNLRTSNYYPVKCWWVSRSIGRSDCLKKVDKSVAAKMTKIYHRHIEGLSGGREQILKNGEILSSHHPLYETGVPNYANWTLHTLLKWGQSCPKVYQIGVQTLGGLGRRHILPDNPPKEIFDYAADYEEDGWDNFDFCLARSPLSFRCGEGGMERICQNFVRKLNQEFKRNQTSKGDRWKRIWAHFRELVEDRRTNKIMQIQVMTQATGIQLMTRAFGVDNQNLDQMDLTTWSKSQGFVLEMTRSFLQDKYGQSISQELLTCKKFLVQVTSFLPRFFKKFKQDILTLSTWKIIEPYFGIIMKISQEPVVLERIFELGFLTGLKSSLEIISGLWVPCQFGHELLRTRFSLFIFVLLFCTLVKIDEDERVKKNLQNFKEELIRFDNGNKYNSKIWPWPTYWTEPLTKFMTKLKNFDDPGPGPGDGVAVEKAMKIAERVVEFGIK